MVTAPCRGWLLGVLWVTSFVPTVVYTQAEHQLHFKLAINISLPSTGSDDSNNLTYLCGEVQSKIFNRFTVKTAFRIFEIEKADDLTLVAITASIARDTNATIRSLSENLVHNVNGQYLNIAGKTVQLHLWIGESRFNTSANPKEVADEFQQCLESQNSGCRRKENSTFCSDIPEVSPDQGTGDSNDSDSQKWVIIGVVLGIVGVAGIVGLAYLYHRLKKRGTNKVHDSDSGPPPTSRSVSDVNMSEASGANPPLPFFIGSNKPSLAPTSTGP